VKVTVRLYAILRQRAGWHERVIELPACASIEDAWRRLAEEQPALASSRPIVRFAVNRRYATTDERLADGDELVLIPPVAGGAPGDAGGTGADQTSLLRCELSSEPIADGLLGELRATVPTAADGALVIFVGQTRETPGTPAPGEEAEAARHAGQPVVGLDYEAFAEMALDVLRQIGGEIAARFGVRRLAIVHRIGRVPVGEPSVVIAAAAAHRDAAFLACRYAIEELKARAPIWKAELYAGGSVWIGSRAREG
jgi:molybdopterin synthase catalytic subunit/molybdopterin converting factor small subunit